MKFILASATVAGWGAVGRGIFEAGLRPSRNWGIVPFGFKERKSFDRALSDDHYATPARGIEMMWAPPRVCWASVRDVLHHFDFASSEAE